MMCRCRCEGEPNARDETKDPCLKIPRTPITLDVVGKNKDKDTTSWSAAVGGGGQARGWESKIRRGAVVGID